MSPGQNIYKLCITTETDFVLQCNPFPLERSENSSIHFAFAESSRFVQKLLNPKCNVSATVLLWSIHLMPFSHQLVIVLQITPLHLFQGAGKPHPDYLLNKEILNCFHHDGIAVTAIGHVSSFKLAYQVQNLQLLWHPPKIWVLQLLSSRWWGRFYWSFLLCLPRNCTLYTNFFNTSKGMNLIQCVSGPQERKMSYCLFYVLH